MIFIFVEKVPTLKKRVRKLGRKRLLKIPMALVIVIYFVLVMVISLRRYVKL